MDWSAVPELRYPDRLNATAVLLDHWIESGHGDRNGAAPCQRDLDLPAAPRHRQSHRRTCSSPTTAWCRAAGCCCAAPTIRCWWPAGSPCSRPVGVAVTTMPLLRPRELAEIVERAEVRLALTDADVAADLETALRDRPGAEVVRFNSTAPDGLEARIAARSAEFTSVLTAADDPAIIAFTSGTTGRAKATVHFHRDLLAVADTYGRYILQPRARRHLHRLAAARLHLRPRRAGAVPDALRRLDGAARPGDAAADARRHPELPRHRHRDLADRLPGDAARRPASST